MERFPISSYEGEGGGGERGGRERGEGGGRDREREREREREVIKHVKHAIRCDCTKYLDNCTQKIKYV